MTDSWLDGADDRLLETEKEQTALAEAENWSPEPGDMLHGTVVEGKIVSTKHGNSTIINVLDAETQKIITVWCSRFILKNLVSDLAPMPTKGISIKYVGLKQPSSDGGNPFHMYVMDVEASDHAYWETVHEAFLVKQRQEGSAPIRQAPNPQDDLEDPF